MDNQGNKKLRKSSKQTRIVTLLCTGMALLLTLMWFMPLITVTVFGERESFSMLDYLQYLDEFNSKYAHEATDNASTMWLCVISCAISIVWALIRKKWASIVGLIYSFFPMFLCIGQVQEWKNLEESMPDFGKLLSVKLGFGANLLIPLSIIVTALFIVTIIYISKDKKRNQLDNSATQPPVEVV